MNSISAHIVHQADNAAIAFALQSMLKQRKIQVKVISINGDHSEERSLEKQLQNVEGIYIVLVTDNFLKSKNCMHNILPVVQEKMFKNELILVIAPGITKENGKPVVVPTEFEKIKNVIEYMNFWQNQYLELRKHPAQNSSEEESMAVELQKVRAIASEVGEFLRFVRSVEHYPIDQLTSDDGSALFSIMKMMGVHPSENQEVTKPEEPTTNISYTPVIEENKQELTEEDIEDDFDEKDLPDIPGFNFISKEDLPVFDEDDEEDEEPLVETYPSKMDSEEAIDEEDNDDIDLIFNSLQDKKEKILQESTKPTEEDEPFPTPPLESPKIIEQEPQKIFEEKKKQILKSYTSEQSSPKALHFQELVLKQAFEDAEKGNVEKAVSDINVYLRQNPNNIKVRYHFALLLAKYKRNLFDAKDQLIQVLKFDRFNVKAFYLLGELAEIDHDYRLALEYYEKVAVLEPTFENIHYKLGCICADHFTGLKKNAVNHFKKALIEKPDSEEIHYRYASLLWSHFGKSAKSIKHFQKVLQTNSKHLFANYDIALIYHELGEQELTQKYFEKAVLNNPELNSEGNRRAFKFHSEIELEHIRKSNPSEQIVLITGATSGIGKATAKLLAKNGYRLILCGRRKERLDTLKDDLKANFRADCYCLSFDITVNEEIDDAIESLPDAWKNIDVLLNNAGKAKGLAPIHESEWKHWQEMIDTNVKGLLYITRKISPQMVARKKGHIINISSSAGKEVYPNGAVYCATKFAVEALTKGMRLDLHPYGIKVGQISPGHVEETEFAMVRFDGDAQKASIYNDFQPLKSSDIAEAILFMLNRNDYVNVQDIVLFASQQASATLINRSGR